MIYHSFLCKKAQTLRIHNLSQGSMLSVINCEWTVLLQHFFSLLSTQSAFTLNVIFTHSHTNGRGYQAWYQPAHQGGANIHTQLVQPSGTISYARTHQRVEWRSWESYHQPLYRLSHSRNVKSFLKYQVNIIL